LNLQSSFCIKYFLWQHRIGRYTALLSGVFATTLFVSGITLLVTTQHGLPITPFYVVFSMLKIEECKLYSNHKFDKNKVMCLVTSGCRRSASVIFPSCWSQIAGTVSRRITDFSPFKSYCVVFAT
jgi:hypothetical protein